jgi:uncharacterized membrane protein YbhN (UPF0104 family)
MTQPASRRAVFTAWAVPLCVLPSAVWRLTEVGRVTTDRWYLVLLSVLSLLLALLTLGLVQRWGERFPPRLVTTSATTGGVLLLAVTAYVGLNAVFGFVERGPVFIGEDQPALPPPGWDVGVYYLPLLLWAPLLLVVTRDYRRRRALG